MRNSKLLMVLFILILSMVNIVPCYSTISSVQTDTILFEKVDASDFVLTYHFAFDKADTAKSNRMMQEQEDFLYKMEIPASGLEEVNAREKFDFLSLIKNYSSNVKKLEQHQYLNMYRQAASQMIVKYLCSINCIAEANIQPPHNQIMYYMNEMKNSGGVNIGLFYTSFLKLQYNNSHKDLCEKLSEIIPYCQTLIKKQKEDFFGTSEDANMNPVDIFIMKDQTARLKANNEYISEMEKMKSIVCH